MRLMFRRQTDLERKRFTKGVLFLLALGAAGSARGEGFIVKNGMPRAAIVIADEPARMTRLAAEELQAQLHAISGARLVITNAPGTNVGVRVYVGRSPHTDRLGLTDEGLEDGAFRIASGPDYLVLLGCDQEFEPPQPWARHHGYLEATRAEWDALTGAAWGNPVGTSLYRAYNGRLDIWAYDERGSLNAVYAFLRRLGARWYMPGPLGEILPELRDIPLPAWNETVHPAVALRCMTPLGTTYSSLKDEDLFWQLRLGLNAHCRAIGTAPHLSHGLRHVLQRLEMKAAHPEYYAMINGQRDTNRTHACLSSEGLFHEAVRFARAVYDLYDARTVSMMPEDGFTFCQCARCAGRDTPERGRLGLYSDYVWRFVDRVAREVYRTHPDRTINCFSYGTYTLAPPTIERFSPNLQVGMVHGRGWYFPDSPVQYHRAEFESSILDVRREWLARTHRPLLGWEHYPFTHRGTFLPVYFPNAIDAGLKAIGDSSLGEFVEVAFGPFEVRGHGLHRPAFQHLNLYLTARLYWDPDQNTPALLQEYFDAFYGPAAAEMKAFVAESEAQWTRMNDDADAIAQTLKRFHAARASVEPGSVYAERLARLADYLLPLEQRGEQLRRGRGDVPEARIQTLRGPEAAITIDGRLEEAAWGPYLAQYRGHGLRDAVTGERADPRTSFLLRWTGGPPGGVLYLGILCEEPDIHGIASRGGAGDPAVLEGDAIEFLVETQAHSHYHFAVNPAGALVEFDRQGGKVNRDWTAGADVAVHVGEDFWSAEMRIPVPGLDRLADPLHEVAGRRPSPQFPWFGNVARRRVRDGRVDVGVWSLTGPTNLHEVMTFGKLYVR